MAALDRLFAAVGTVPTPAADLVRIAAMAYAVDCATKRPRTFSRRLSISVGLEEPGAWTTDPARLPTLQELLEYLTGDEWSLSIEGGASPVEPAAEQAAAHAVCLLSGGLDSFCGALLQLGRSPGGDVLFLSHADSNPVIASQGRVMPWLRAHVKSDLRHLTAQLWSGTRPEGSTRTRSLLFLCLAVATAAAVGAGWAVVPENGFTSLNPPLTPNRGGALTTRSTHPWTLWRLQELITSLGIPVAIDNPHEQLTKGELVAAVRALGRPFDPEDGFVQTLSCAKFGGNFYGTSPHMNCGLCVACIVRRAALEFDGHADPTPYSCNHAPASRLPDLIRARRADIRAVRWATEGPITASELTAWTSFPPGYDIDAAVELCNRGLREIAEVTLPDA